MRPASAKAKGRRLQNQVAEDIRTLPGLVEGDVVPAIMGQSGMDITLSPGKQHIFPFAVECKNQESLNIWAAMAQAEANSPADLEALLVFTRNGAPTYACLSWAELLGISGYLADLRNEVDGLEQEVRVTEEELAVAATELDDAEDTLAICEGEAEALRRSCPSPWGTWKRFAMSVWTLRDRSRSLRRRWTHEVKRTPSERPVPLPSNGPRLPRGQPARVLG